MLVSPRAKPRQADKDRAADIPDSVHPFWFNNSWSHLVAGQIGVRSPKPVTGKISQPLRALEVSLAEDRRSRERSLGKGNHG
jgi:hypothetical protein